MALSSYKDYVESHTQIPIAQGCVVVLQGKSSERADCGQLGLAIRILFHDKFPRNDGAEVSDYY